MHTFSVIEQLNIFKYISLYLFHCIVFSLEDMFFFQSCKETLYTGVVIWTGRPAHTSIHPIQMLMKLYPTIQFSPQSKYLIIFPALIFEMFYLSIIGCYILLHHTAWSHHAKLTRPMKTACLFLFLLVLFPWLYFL